jgi:hypothetical protein
MTRADPSKTFYRPCVKKLRKFSCAPFGLVQPSSCPFHPRPEIDFDSTYTQALLNSNAFQRRRTAHAVLYIYSLMFVNIFWLFDLTSGTGWRWGKVRGNQTELTSRELPPEVKVKGLRVGESGPRPVQVQSPTQQDFFFPFFEFSLGEIKTKCWILG